MELLLLEGTERPEIEYPNKHCANGCLGGRLLPEHNAFRFHTSRVSLYDPELGQKLVSPSIS